MTLTPAPAFDGRQGRVLPRLRLDEPESVNEPHHRVSSGSETLTPGASSRSLGVTLFGVGLLVLGALAAGSAPAPALRFAGVAVVAVGWSLAIALLTPVGRWAPEWRDALLLTGVVRRVPMPWFDRELDEAARDALGRALRARPWTLAAWVALVCLALGALVGTRGLASPMTGLATLVPGERVDAVALDAPTPGLSHPLGVTVELLDASTDAASPSATLRLRRLSDGVEREHSLRAGERAIVGGRGMSLESVGMSGIAGVAAVQIGGEPHMMHLGERVTSGGLSFEFADADVNRLGQLGPGARMIVRDADGAVVRDAWVYEAASTGFDGRHHDTALDVVLQSLGPAPIATVRVTESVVSARTVQGVAGLLVAALLVLTLVLWLRPVVLATGRDGDRWLYVIGLTGTSDPVALHRDVIGWLSPAQVADLSALLDTSWDTP